MTLKINQLRLMTLKINQLRLMTLKINQLRLMTTVDTKGLLQLFNWNYGNIFLLLKEIDQAVEMCAVCCFDENFDIILLLLITSLELCPLVDIAYRKIKQLRLMTLKINQLRLMTLKINQLRLMTLKINQLRLMTLKIKQLRLMTLKINQLTLLIFY
jgi:hypothetical protein